MFVPFGLIYRRIGWTIWTAACLLLISCTEHTPPTGGGTGTTQGFDIQIEKTHNSEMGTVEIVDVTLNRGFYRPTSFDLTIWYFDGALEFRGATPGQLLTECGWDSFNCTVTIDEDPSIFPVGRLHISGTADTSGRGTGTDPGCENDLLDTGPVVLFSLELFLKEDRTLECGYWPIRFYWEDCDDNVVGYNHRRNFGQDAMAVARDIFDFDLIGRITNDSLGFPTFQGFQRECFYTDLGRQFQAVPMINFYNGGVDNVCADSDIPKVPTPDMGR